VLPEEFREMLPNFILIFEVSKGDIATSREALYRLAITSVS
jgi:hypothetical protein